jgi:hypothetical protein
VAIQHYCPQAPSLQLFRHKNEERLLPNIDRVESKINSALVRLPFSAGTAKSHPQIPIIFLMKQEGKAPYWLYINKEMKQKFIYRKKKGKKNL